MREKDLYNLMTFITRMGMYIPEATEKSIISFIHGYEIGSDGKCNISSLLSDLLSNEYNIERMASGLSCQIKEYSKQNNQDWIISFKQLVLKYFYNTQNFKIDSDFKTFLKNRITSKIDQLNLNWVALGFKSWTDEWKSLVDVKQEKFQKMWTPKELKIIIALDNEIHSQNELELTSIFLDLRSEFRTI